MPDTQCIFYQKQSHNFLFFFGIKTFFSEGNLNYKEQKRRFQTLKNFLPRPQLKSRDSFLQPPHFQPPHFMTTFEKICSYYVLFVDTFLNRLHNRFFSTHFFQSLNWNVMLTLFSSLIQHMWLCSIDQELINLEKQVNHFSLSNVRLLCFVNWTLLDFTI